MYKTNYVGITRGKITAIHQSHKRRKCGTSVVVVTYKCECGNIKSVSATSFMHSKSCGCPKKYTGKDSKGWKGCGSVGKRFLTSIISHKKRREIEFDITIEQIWELYLKQNQKCALTGILIKFDTKARKGDGSASLDRIDSNKGYTIDNVQLVHKKINIMKNIFPQEEFIYWCQLVTLNSIKDYDIDLELSNLNLDFMNNNWYKSNKEKI